jgi:hypothetical protein
MTQWGFRGGQFPEDDDRDGSRNVGSLAIRPSYAAAYWLVFISTNIVILILLQTLRNLCKITTCLFSVIMTSKWSSLAVMCNCRSIEMLSVETLGRCGKCIILSLIFNGHSTCSFPAWFYIPHSFPVHPTPPPPGLQILLHIKIGCNLNYTRSNLAHEHIFLASV